MACKSCGATHTSHGFEVRTVFCVPCGIKHYADTRRARYGGAQGRAHRAVRAAVQRGALPHPSELGCSDCPKGAEVYDHRDYRKPLAVDPVCRSCNRRRGVSEFLFTKDGRAVDSPTRLMAEAVWSLVETRAA